MIEFNYNKVENIIYVKRFGDIYLKDIIDVIDNINDSYKSIKHLYILQDTSESEMNYSLEELEIMIDKFKSRLVNFEIVKIANITNDPIETATAYVFEDLAEYVPKLHHKTFSTVDFAKQWLKNGMITSD